MNASGEQFPNIVSTTHHPELREAWHGKADVNAPICEATAVFGCGVRDPTSSRGTKVDRYEFVEGRILRTLIASTSFLGTIHRFDLGSTSKYC